jgi:hypothetical protein
MASWVPDKTKFLELYPEFTGQVSDAQFANYSVMALQFFDAAKYQIPPAVQDTYYYLIMAHLISLGQRGGSGGVGAVNSASEGTVSVGFTTLNNINWWQQTSYGAMFWQLIKPYLTPRWISGGNGCVHG